jgi:hypothetical protein
MMFWLQKGDPCSLEMVVQINQFLTCRNDLRWVSKNKSNTLKLNGKY